MLDASPIGIFLISSSAWRIPARFCIPFYPESISWKTAKSCSWQDIWFCCVFLPAAAGDLQRMNLRDACHHDADTNRQYGGNVLHEIWRKSSVGRFVDRCLDAVSRYRDPNFYAPVFYRVTEAIFKIRFAPVGKQLPAVFLNSKIQYGPLAQLGERQVRNLEVRGSIPLWSTKQVLDEHLFFQWRFRREVFALIHNRKAPSWKWFRDGAFPNYNIECTYL